MDLFCICITHLFCHIFWTSRIKKTSPFDASLIGLYTPIVTVVFGSLFKVTLFDFKSFIGLVTMTIGVLLLYL